MFAVARRLLADPELAALSRAWSERTRRLAGVFTAVVLLASFVTFTAPGLGINRKRSPSMGRSSRNAPAPAVTVQSGALRRLSNFGRCIPRWKCSSTHATRFDLHGAQHHRRLHDS